ncbi:tRNA pseudouridine(55) synthase TruB [Sphingomonas sp.]|uniref:tRNA pseudouridine(55) synthase TruB n=1 Tax=Sphingomonas sp. TaxID=28214 RepID=UPI003AFF9F7D
MTAHNRAPRLGPALHGWLVIDKPVGPGSTDIVSRVKRALRDGGYAKVKVGHGGTLDPLASGVLPVALGEATKLCGRALDSDKAYAFTVRFGEETDTLDAEGAVIATSDVRPALAQVEAVLPSFTGATEQVPPAYSALKVEGRRAYDLARSGEAVTLASRQVTVRDLRSSPSRGGEPREAWWRGSDAAPHPSTACGGPPPLAGEDDVTLEAAVSKGTYIRSLARDIAHALGTVGHVTMLRRTRAGPFGLAEAISLDILAELAKARALEQALLPLSAGLDDIPAFALTPDQAAALRQGRRVIGTPAPPGPYLATDRSVPVALVDHDGTGMTVVRGFNL